MTTNQTNYWVENNRKLQFAVARALMNDPKIILADEPSGNLDTSSAENLHKLFFKLRDEMGQTFIIVTHNNELADMADRKLLICRVPEPPPRTSTGMPAASTE